MLIMVEKFQCPGCMIGYDTRCGAFNLEGNPQEGQTCTGWHPGTFRLDIGTIALGLPKGFNRLGTLVSEQNKGTVIRLFYRDDYQAMLDGPIDEPELRFCDLNVPVWAMEENGYLFVRTFAPRISRHWIDVIKDGTLSMVTQAIDVSKFKNNID